MYYIDINIQPSPGTHKCHFAYIEIPNKYVEIIGMKNIWGIPYNVAILTSDGIKYCKEKYMKVLNWNPEVYNYELVVMTKKMAREAKKSMDKMISIFMKEYRMVSRALANIE